MKSFLKKVDFVIVRIITHYGWKLSSKLRNSFARAGIKLLNKAVNDPDLHKLDYKITMWFLNKRRR